MRLVRSILLSAGLGLMAVPAAADPWFLHEFGELRAYFKDWLVVCEDEGRGACRAVQYQPDPDGDGTWGIARMAVHRLSQGGHGLVLYIKGMNSAAAHPVTVLIDERSWQLAPEDWRPGDLAVRNVAETITFTDPLIADQVLGAMRAGLSMTVTSGDGQTAMISLRGLTASRLAMDEKAQENAQ